MKLIKKDLNRYRLVDTHYEVEGDIAFIREHLIADVGMEIEELEFALATMEALKHDAADFGVNHMFTFSHNVAQVNKVLAELTAIDQVKTEMYQAYNENKESSDFKSAQARLLTLALTLDTKSVLQLLSNTSNRVA